MHTLLPGYGLDDYTFKYSYELLIYVAVRRSVLRCSRNTPTRARRGSIEVYRERNAEQMFRIAIHCQQ